MSNAGELWGIIWVNMVNSCVEIGKWGWKRRDVVKRGKQWWGLSKWQWNKWYMGNGYNPPSPITPPPPFELPNFSFLIYGKRERAQKKPGICVAGNCVEKPTVFINSLNICTYIVFLLTSYHYVYSDAGISNTLPNRGCCAQSGNFHCKSVCVHSTSILDGVNECHTGNDTGAEDESEFDNV